MQQSLRPIPHNRHIFRLPLILGSAALLSALCAGCGPTAALGPAAPAPRPHENVALALSCPDEPFARAIAPMVKAWEARTGARVALARAPMAPDDATDLAVIPAGELGAWAEPGRLAPVPAALRSDPALQWRDFLPAYAERLVEWGGQTFAVPLTGDAAVLVYRRDRLADPRVRDALAKRHPGRAAAPPASWDELADLAAVLAELDGKPSLPPLPADPGRALDLFSRVAACADRRALSDAELAAAGSTDAEALAFQFAVGTGAPRVRAPGFKLAADLFARLHAAKALPAGAPGPDDPAAALAEGRAALAVLSLEQVARLPKENGAVAARFAVAPLPGAGTFFDPRARRVVTGAPNFVPHFAGGRLGVVRARTAHAAAAFELLAELAGPARGAELVATPGLSAGPTRGAHLERDRLSLWLGYGFDAEGTRALQEALRGFVSPTVRNPTIGLRGPDRAAVVAAAGAALRQCGTGTPADAALAEAERAWLAADAQFPAADLKRWRARAAGAN